ncbi:hypothetical protein [Cyclobacterium jeungdonense]|uniref:Uncharacterized protein n=1 Tax=Cyclobacterium jeungdonense TaxID=708087 RepID=A0ABT8C5I8_9BACT|nr:hypothetical protein [Cyclobacterium jeungdonense]MDN3688060.1 hypothetical protein [Cyclobacterium jeungdonense]
MDSKNSLQQTEEATDPRSAEETRWQQPVLSCKRWFNPLRGWGQDLTAHRPRVSPGVIFIEAPQASEPIR